MAEVFLIAQHHPQKMLKFLKEQIVKTGLDCEVLESPLEALRIVKECFGIKYKQVPNIRSLKVGPFRVIPSDYSLKFKKTHIKLRRKEFELFQFFAANRNKPVNRNTLLESVWGPNSNIFSNTLDVHVASLRKKINTPENTYLKTIHGVGFMFCV